MGTQWQGRGIADPAESWCNWVIHLRDDGRLAGFVQATVTAPHGTVADTATAGARAVGHRHLDEAAPAVAGPVAEIAWVVGTQWQGRGIAVEAARGMAVWLGRRGVRTLMAHIHPDHRASPRWPRPADWSRRTCGRTARSAGPALPPQRLPRLPGADQGVRVGDDV
nr:GNAT family N-acetyltransferase [Micromonospora provocatoris]